MKVLCVLLLLLCKTPWPLPPVVPIFCVLSLGAGSCQLVIYMLIFPEEKPNPILVAWPALAGGPGSLGPDCAFPFPSHSEAHAHWPQALSLISQPGFTLSYTRMMGDHIAFCVWLWRENTRERLFLQSLCAPHCRSSSGVGEVGVVGVLPQGAPSSQHSLYFSPESPSQPFWRLLFLSLASFPFELI